MSNLNFKLAGEYKILVKKADGSVIETDWFPNMILDQGLDRIGNGANSVIAYAQVGTGTTAPSALQTSLISYVAGSASSLAPDSISNSGSPNYETTYTWDFTFAQGAVVGNITELGVGWSASGSTLFSRALILDNLGSPTSITIIALDQLTVYYRLKIIPPLGDITGSVTIGGTPYDYTARVSSAGTFANALWTFWGTQVAQSGSLIVGRAAQTYGAGSVLGAITGNPTISSGTASGTATGSSYTPGSFTRDFTYTWSITQGNATGGVQSIVFVYGVQDSMKFQYRFDTVIPKDNTKTMSITTNISWNRV